MDSLSNVSLAYEKVRQINPWISDDIVSFTCPQGSNVAGLLHCLGVLL